ncbi:MAG: DNA-binding protein [Candidatus Nezhaarchaeales archaeon]
MARVLLMSIKPKYGYDILRGIKKIELRGFVGDIAPGDIVVLYLSSPVQAICGEFRVGRVVFGLEEARRFVDNYGDSGVSDEDWLYVIGKKRPMAIEVLNPIEYPVKVTLSDLRRLIPGFRPPLSYRSVKPWEELYNVITRIRRLSGLL